MALPPLSPSLMSSQSLPLIPLSPNDYNELVFSLDWYLNTYHGSPDIDSDSQQSQQYQQVKHIYHKLTDNANTNIANKSHFLTLTMQEYSYSLTVIASLISELRQSVEDDYDDRHNHTKNPKLSWSTFDRGLRLGITLLLFFWVLWDCVVDARLRPTNDFSWVQSVLPVYRGIGVLLMLEWGWGCNLYIWAKYKISFHSLLELDPRSTLTHTEVFDEATEASLMFLGNFLLYFKVLRGDFPPWIPAGYFPILLFLYMVYKLLPWAGGRQRWQIWQGLGQVIAAPFGRVSFLTVYIGDILTSLVKPIIDWSYTVCFLVTLEWVDDKVNDEICYQSSAFNYVVVPLLSAFPLWFRFMQCLKRYLDTQKRWPHLANAGKYALSHTVVLFGVFHHTFTDPQTIDAYRIYWIISLVISSLYSYAWDVFMDWGLGSARHGGLRESMMYPSKWIYYSAIVADLFLRFAWSLTLVPRGDNAPFAPSVIYYLQPLLAVAEVVRRCMWGALRLEFEHIQTIGYKKIEGSSGNGSSPMPVSSTSDDHRTGWQILLEVSLIAATVLSIGLFAALTAD